MIRDDTSSHYQLVQLISPVNILKLDDISVANTSPSTFIIDIPHSAQVNG